MMLSIGALAGHVVGILGLGRRVLLPRLTHRDLQRAKALLRRSNRRFAASGLLASRSQPTACPV